MSIQIQGTLLNPSGGNPAAGAQIRFISLAGWSGVPKGAESIEITGADGSYDFPLQHGRYAVAINQNGVFAKQGSAVVNNETPSPLTIDELMEFSEPLTPGEIKYVEELVAQAELARDKSQQYANEASQSAVEASYEVAKAAQQVGYAEDQVDLAKAEVVNASNEADRAKSEADRASEVAGLDTVEEAVDMALSEYAGVMTTSERDAILAANEEKYAASGMVDMGKHQDGGGYTPINEGLASRTDASGWANQLAWGSLSGANHKGASKTNAPVSHIAGVVSEILSVNFDNIYVPNKILLPPAPNGTVIYDSTGDARGTGKANLNLRTEIDPKYGDIASTDNEAVARAFEGQCKNGDLRLGDNGDWTLASESAIANGKLTITNATATRNNYQRPPVKTGGTEYVLSAYVEVVAGEVRLQFGGGSGGLFPVTETGYYTFKGTFNTTYFYVQGITGFTGSVSNISIKEATEEVVTDRVDMFGLEPFDMVMKDNEVFDMVQSQSSTFGTSGVPTVDSIRPDSFFAVYDGQTGISKGKCVRWPDLNRAQKRHIAKYMKERLWINEDGDLTFTTIRQRSFAGFGNGDWFNIDSTEVNHYGQLKFSRSVNVASVAPQGDRDTVPVDGISSCYYGTNNQYNIFDGKYKGVFSPRYDSYAYKGRCFFYVLGTVSRLNQGAYYPNLNESGAKAFLAPNLGDIRKWYQTKNIEPKTTADCFKYLVVHPNTGAIGQTSGREDDRAFDAIYADGEGGVVDYRLSAYDMSSPEESAKAWEKVKNGTYRGLEKLVRTKLDTQLSSDSPSGWNTEVSDTSLYTVGDICYLEQTDGTYHKVYLVNKTATHIYWDSTRSQAGRKLNGVIVHESELNTSVSGNFTMTDVIGDPANILQTDALKNGWQGSWIPVVPNGTNLEMPATRKVMLSAITRQRTEDNGATWTSDNLNIDLVKNSNTGYHPNSGIQIWTYTAFAKQTKPSTNKPVLNGEAGLGSVFEQAWHGTSWGGLLSESLIGEVITNNTGTPFSSLSLESVEISLDAAPIGGISEYRFPKHSPLALGAPGNNSQAVKALPYQISDNGQCSIGVQANELTWGSPTITDVSDQTVVAAVQYGLYKITDTASLLFGKVIRRIGGDNTVNLTGYYIQDGKMYSPSNNYDPVWGVWSGNGWGDDSTMKITAGGSDTFVDLNGNTNLSVVHELALPIGWTHNHARVSTQVAGVDL